MSKYVDYIVCHRAIKISPTPWIITIVQTLRDHLNNIYSLRLNKSRTSCRMLVCISLEITTICHHFFGKSTPTSKSPSRYQDMQVSLNPMIQIVCNVNTKIWECEASSVVDRITKHLTKWITEPIQFPKPNYWLAHVSTKFRYHPRVLHRRNNISL